MSAANQTARQLAAAFLAAEQFAKLARLAFEGARIAFEGGALAFHEYAKAAELTNLAEAAEAAAARKTSPARVGAMRAELAA